MNKVLDADTIAALLTRDKQASDPRTRYPVPPQEGPFRWYDSEFRCASRGCGSPTRYKLQGIPYCSVHLINKMNDMLIELGVER